MSKKVLSPIVLILIFLELAFRHWNWIGELNTIFTVLILIFLELAFRHETDFIAEIKAKLS